MTEKQSFGALNFGIRNPRMKQPSDQSPGTLEQPTVTWFRLYHDVIADPKIQRLPIELRWRWIETLAIASRQKTRGTLPNIEDIAFMMRVPRARAQQIIDALVDCGLIDVSEPGNQLTVHDWDQHQRQSDTSADRVKRHRDRCRNVTGNEDVTLQETLRNDDGNALRNASRARSRAGADSETETEEENTPLKPPKGGKPKRKRRPPFDPSTMLLPEWIPRKLWDDWIDARTKKNGRPTQGSLETAIEKLDRWRSDGEDIREVLENAVIGGYAGLFLPNNRNRNGNGHAAPAPPPRPRSEPKPFTRAEYERRLLEIQEQ